MAATRNAVQQAVLDGSRLGIPASFSQEALHSAGTGATVFPESVTLGGSWDVALVENVSAAIARGRAPASTSRRARHQPVADARFGRLQEGFSENPALTSAYAAAARAGLPGPRARRTRRRRRRRRRRRMVLPRPRQARRAREAYYAAYGAALGGLNGAPAELTTRTLNGCTWRRGARVRRAGGRGAMAAHNTVDGVPCHSNSALINGQLRGALGFGDGIVLSDCNDVPALVDFKVAANLSHAAAKALGAGVDLDLQCGTKSAFTYLNASLRDGLVDAASLDRAARRVLMAKLAAGLFENPLVDADAASAALDSDASRALALRAAEEGVVLVATTARSADAATLGSLAVIGPNAGCSADAPAEECRATGLLGSYQSNYAHGRVRRAGRDRLRGAARRAAPARRRRPRARRADGGRRQPHAHRGRGRARRAQRRGGARARRRPRDVRRVGRPRQPRAAGAQLPLLEAVAATGTPTIVVHVGGRTASFGGPANAVLANVSALVAAFRPGMFGARALANVLTGATNPSGRLAQNWVRSAGQTGSGASPWRQWRVGKWVANGMGDDADPDGRRYDPYVGAPASPLFYFGHGLSYTTFAFSELAVAPAARAGARGGRRRAGERARATARRPSRR